MGNDTNGGRAASTVVAQRTGSRECQGLCHLRSLVLSSEGHIEARTSIQPYEVYINNKILYEPCQVANVWERRSAVLTLMNNAIYTPVNRRNLYYIVILFSVSCLLLLIYYHHFCSFHSVPLISNTDHFHIQSIGIRSPHIVFE